MTVENTFSDPGAGLGNVLEAVNYNAKENPAPGARVGNILEALNYNGKSASPPQRRSRKSPGG